MRDSVSSEDVLQEVKDFYSEQTLKFEEYNKSEKTRPMAFLALWCAFEYALKRIGELEKRRTLRNKLHLWIEYLDGKHSKAPKEIKSCTLECKQIPEISLIEDYLGSLPDCIKEAHNSKNKYRRARNDLAHRVDFVSGDKTYNKYVECVTCAIDETIKLLEDKIENGNK